MTIEKDIIPKYYQLEKILRKKIISGAFELSKALPNERELCEEHHVSRTTVRNAMASLERDGLIFREQGRGTFVKYDPKLWSFNLKGSVDDMFNLGAGTTLKLEQKTLVRQENWLVKDMKAAKPEQVYLVEGIRSWRDGSKGLFQAYIPKEIGEKINIDQFKGYLFIQTVETVAEELVKKVLQFTYTEKVNQVLADKINVAVGQDILVQKRIYYSRNNQVMQVSFNRFPVHLYRDAVEFKRD
ncbi:GntR family transcriptional regulator [bacterium]|nr:GntR family transcriptional regulator [bacterium]